MYKLSKINTQLIIKSIASVVLTVMLICIAVISFCIYSNSGFSYLIKAVSFYYDKEIIISKSSCGKSLKTSTLNSCLTFCKSTQGSYTLTIVE